MPYAQPGHRRRDVGIAVTVGGLHALAIGVLLTWKFVAPAPGTDPSLVLIEIREPQVEQPPADTRRSGAKPANHAPPAPAAAHPEDIRINATEPIIATPQPEASPPASAAGTAATGGSASTGQGSGGGGNGPGAGAGGSRPRWISGTIRDSDYPRAASRAKAGGMVIVHFDVLVDGRVRNCRVARSSGNNDLDQTTCRLVEQRFRYAPATDANGRAISDVAGWKQDWWLEPRR